MHLAPLVILMISDEFNSFVESKCGLRGRNILKNLKYWSTGYWRALEKGPENKRLYI